MIRVVVKRKGIITHDNMFTSRGEAEGWVAQVGATGALGVNQWTERVEDSFDEQGSVVPGKTIEHPADYQVEFEDKTAQVEAEKLKNDNRKNKRIQRIAQLKAIDWSKIKTVAQMVTLMEHVVNEMLKDEE